MKKSVGKEERFFDLRCRFISRFSTRTFKFQCDFLFRLPFPAFASDLYSIEKGQDHDDV
jgi:hypothetical protein